MKAHRAQAIFLCLILFSTLFSACCAGSFAPGVPVSSKLHLQSIQITPTESSVLLGQNQQLTATGYYSDGSIKDITASAAWASSNTSVATFSGPGSAKGNADGSVIVRAMLSGVAGYGTLTVTGKLLVSITITPANQTLILATVLQCTATGTYTDHSVQDITSSVTWASSNNSLVWISQGGFAAGVALGSATISATLGSVSGSTMVTVQPATLVSLVIGPQKRKIAMLTSLQYYAAGTYSDGSIRYITAKCSWTLSNTTVGKVLSPGRVRGLVPGTTTVTATIGSFSASATLVVTDATIVSLAVTPIGQTIPQGFTLRFIATGLFSDKTHQVITQDCTWASDNHAVATLRSLDVAVGVGAGTANISATFTGVSGSTPLTVSSATLYSISVTPATATLAPGTFVDAVATGTFSDGTTGVITNIVTWTSSAPSVAIVDGGAVIAETGGTAIISAQLGSVSGNATITVDASPLTSIQISPPTATTPQQTVVAFKAIGTFADGNTQDLTTFAFWTSSQPSVATINAGQASGLTPGTSVITALFGGQVGVATLTVTANAAKPISLVVSPAAADFESGSVTRFTALADFSDGTTQDVSPWATWTSSNKNVAAARPTGLATSTGARTTTLTATMNAANATAVLNVH